MTSPRQMDWLATPERTRKGNRYAEFRLQCAVASTLRQFINPKWRAVHLPFGEHRTPATAGRLKRMGVEPGWPDWLLVGPGRVCFLELKRGNGKPSKEQAEIATHVMMCGCGYGIAWTYDNAIGMLKDWGVIPPTVRVQ